MKSYRNSTMSAASIQLLKDDPQMECSDFNDLHKLRGLRETARQLFATANRLKTGTDLLSLTLNRLKTIKRDNRRTFAKELLRAVDIAC
ncbi:hypothetical protein [Escherichia coli]|uniref:hypothetical protein n=1 Tax=Escherichia coli TaxID=562 RepID=UPI002FCCF523